MSTLYVKSNYLTYSLYNLWLYDMKLILDISIWLYSVSCKFGFWLWLGKFSTLADIIYGYDDVLKVILTHYYNIIVVRINSGQF